MPKVFWRYIWAHLGLQHQSVSICIIFILMPKKTNILFQLVVIVSALGFFVDVYDLLLFAIIRKPSLSDLGLSSDRILSEGEFLISIQMLGMVR